MANVYARVQKIYSASSRQDYLKEKSKDELVFFEEHKKFEWATHEIFEKEKSNIDKKNVVAREIVFALPQDLIKDKNKLKSICDENAKKVCGENRDFDYAVHYKINKENGNVNLHQHLLFSERKNNIELEPKIYKRDIWKDKTTKKLAKANSPNAELIHKKGDIQKDQEGNIKYNNDLFLKKDRKFKTNDYMDKVRKNYVEILNNFGYEDYQVFDKNGYFLPQKKEGFYSGHKIENAREYNDFVKEHNKQIEENLKQNPELEPELIKIKKATEKEIKKENKIEKKISDKSIEFVKNITQILEKEVEKFKVFFNFNNQNEEEKAYQKELEDEKQDIEQEIEEIEDEIYEEEYDDELDDDEWEL